MHLAVPNTLQKSGYLSLLIKILFFCPMFVWIREVPLYETAMLPIKVTEAQKYSLSNIYLQDLGAKLDHWMSKYETDTDDKSKELQDLKVHLQ